MAKIMKILLLLLLFVAGGTSATKPKCEELKGTVELANDPEICEVVSSSGDATLGNSKEPMTLDISKADETTLNTFLAKFTEIHGAIVMEGNDQVATLNLGTIKEFDGKKISPDDKFIFIRNNPKLAKIDWNNAVDVMDRDVVMLIYNNPLLAATSLDTLHTVLNGKKKIQHHIQRTELNECQFEYPLNMTIPDPSKYIAPSAEFLKNCKKIKGDFIVENAKLAELGPFELGADACLRLVNVDMKDVKITAAANTGSETCKDGRKSEITGNPNLCGDELEALHKYYKDPAAVAVKMDPATCTKPCSSDQQSSLYILCEPPTTPPPPTTAPPSTNSTIDPAAGSMVQQTPDTTPNSNDSPSDESKPWLIPVIVVGGLALAAIITLVVLWLMNCLPCCRRHKDDPKKKDPPGGKNKDRGNKQKSDHRHDKPKEKPSAVEEGNVTDVTASDVTSNSKDQHEPMRYTLKNIDETAEHGAVLKAVKSKEKAKPSKEKTKESKTRSASLETAEHKKTPAFSSQSNKQKSNEMKKKKNKKKNSRRKAKKANRRKSASASTSAEDTSGSERDKSKKTTTTTSTETISKSAETPWSIKDVPMAALKAFVFVLIATTNAQDLKVAFSKLDYNGKDGIKDFGWVDTGEKDEITGEPIRAWRQILLPEDQHMWNLLLSGNLMRYCNVPVVLKGIIQLRNKQYVSANLVDAGNRNYICAEAPTEHTVILYWTMILEKLVKNVVMLCNLDDKDKKGKTKAQCFKYFPKEPGMKLKISEKITVECVSKERFSNITKRILRVTIDGVTHELTHHHFTAWPDHGVPKLDDAMDLLPLFSLDNANPILVHCSAGVGRTGVFVLLNMIMDLLKSGQLVNVLPLLRELRSQRATAVQTPAQYFFVYAFLTKIVMEHGHLPTMEMEAAKKYFGDLVSNYNTPSVIVKAKPLQEFADQQPDFTQEDAFPEENTQEEW